MITKLKDGERIDDLQRNGYKLIQNEKLFCFGMDAVLLSAFAKVYEGERVLDLCTGNGVILHLLKGRTKGEHFTGLEINGESVDLARRSIELNNLTNDIDVVCADVKEASSIFKGASFDVITVNPPYMKAGSGLVNPDSQKAIARHEVLCTISDITREAGKLLKSGKRLYMVHRPYRLPEIFEALHANRLEPKNIRFVYPFEDKEANMVLIEAVKDSGSQLIVQKPLIINKEVGVLTDEVADLYNKGSI